MLEPLRKYGLARIGETGEADTVARRHAEYYTDLVSDAATSIHGPDHYEAIERLILERPNVTAALEWSIDNDPDMGLSTLADLAPTFPVIGALADGYQLAERLLNAGGSPHARLSGLLGAGSIAYWLNDYAKAEAHYREAIELSMAHGEDGFRAEALFGRAFSLVWLGQPEEAEKVADLIARPDDDPSTRLSRGTLALGAFVDWMRGDLEAADRKLDDAISASHQIGDETAELFYRLALSGISVLTGEIEKAVPVQLAALLRFSDLQDEGGMLHALDWLAQAAIVRNPSQGVILASAVDSLKRRRGGFIDLTRLGMPDPRERALKHMGPVELEKRWAQGRELDLIGARDLALELANGVGASEKPV